MDKLTRLYRIIEEYERARASLNSRGIDFGQTEGNGFWTATRWDHIIPFLEWSIKNKVLSPPGPVVDAGSGTGEPSAVFNAYGFGPVVNIELDRRLASAANETIDALVKEGVLGGGITTIEGDFTKDDAYKAAGIPFEGARYFYHAINSKPLRDLARRIREESPPGTKLIVYGMFDKVFMPHVNGLTLEHKFRTPDLMADFFVYIVYRK